MNFDQASFPDHAQRHERGADAPTALTRRPVDACLPFSGMTAVPAAFERFALAHFHRSTLKALSWPDACPAYALAWLTHAAYGPELDPASEWELQLQWQDLQGVSNLNWHEARAILGEAWSWLSRHERDVALAGTA